MGRFEGQGSNEYDQRIRRLIPGYALLHELSQAQLLTRLPQEAEILVVGAGTGSEILLLAAQRPAWRFIAVDLSADMLAIARQRFIEAGIVDRVQLHRGELASLPFTTPADAALLLLVLHFIPGFADKQALTSAIAQRLKHGAPLLTADLMRPADPLERTIHGSASALLGLTPDGVATMLARLESDFYPLDTAEQRMLFENAGFIDAVPYFQALSVQGWVALRR
ncbi:class I SAM-dependent methyltransferase [Chitinimonas lacunae]|uniref:Class I SAM-dependent methyltransferase n=1 Tax=Chitinimonas lacunae TaxID=1963018 RepID=A0ABV8MP14_9NEIS